MRLYLVNGFLGSGKTTAIMNTSRLLLADKRSVAVIMNDQGVELVDTAYVRSQNLSALEVTGGCFCCRFDQLAESITLLKKERDPAIIFAESVGSCTDLIATVIKPLNKTLPGIDIAISVFAEAGLLAALVTNQATFINDEVQYIYKKQLSEADILVINKIDLLNEKELRHVQSVVSRDYPDKSILYLDSTKPENLRLWLQQLDKFPQGQGRHSIDINYDTYAKGESLLAWLDQKILITTLDKQAYNVFRELAKTLLHSFRTNRYLVGHLKFILDDGQHQTKISFTALSDAINNMPDISIFSSGKLKVLINARIQCSPGALESIVTEALDKIRTQGAIIVAEDVSVFQPGYPRPQHRMID